MSDLKKSIFLDRDGTINVDKDYLYRIEDFIYLDGALEGLKVLYEAGYQLIIITNQSGIARGYYTESDYQILTEWMIKDLKKKGIGIAGVYYCPHHPEAKMIPYRIRCHCRKPDTELFYRAAIEHNIDFDNSFAIGDKERDLSICKETRVRGILLGEREKEKTGFYDICAGWKEIVEYILK